MKRLNKNEKILIFVVLFLLFVFVFKLLIIGPLHEKLDNAERDIARLQLLVRKYLDLEQQREAILKEYKKIESYLGLKGSDEEKVASILSKIESEASKAGLTIVDMKSDPVQKSRSLPAVYRIRLNAEADITKIFNFIYGLENSGILFKVDKLNLSVKDEDAGIIKLEASILGISIT